MEPLSYAHGIVDTVLYYETYEHGNISEELQIDYRLKEAPDGRIIIYADYNCDYRTEDNIIGGFVESRERIYKRSSDQDFFNPKSIKEAFARLANFFEQLQREYYQNTKDK